MRFYTYLLVSFLALQSLPLLCTAQDVTNVHKALGALYESTNGGQWTDNAGWDTTAVPVFMSEFDQWYGLTVRDETLRSIVLSDNNLRGPLPPELGNLTELTGLSLSNNQLKGPLAPELGNLAELTWLTLDYNGFTGPIPPELVGEMINPVIPIC